jgi:hypothetical protein
MAKPLPKRETLESYIGVEPEKHPLLVIADPEPDEPAEHQLGYLPPTTVTEKPSQIQEIGEFIIEALNKRLDGFDGNWLVWRGMKREKDALAKGKLIFEIQQHARDAYTRGLPRATITIKLPRPPLKGRIVKFFKSLRSSSLEVEVPTTKKE